MKIDDVFVKHFKFYCFEYLFFDLKYYVQVQKHLKLKISFPYYKFFNTSIPTYIQSSALTSLKSSYT